jgi:hypothetical protein
MPKSGGTKAPSASTPPKLPTGGIKQVPKKPITKNP